MNTRSLPLQMMGPRNTPLPALLLAWALGLIALLAVVVAFHDSLARMYQTWMEREEYSHGILVPFISAYLIWQRREQLLAVEWCGSWIGVVLVVAGAAMYLLGELATVYTIAQLAFVVVLYGLLLAAAGPRVLREIIVPLAILLFMVPLPEFILNNFSAEMQLLSSRIGVAVMRLAGVSVYLEGNVIDLGGYKLQVAEACDGLRYLFPLMTLGFIMAYMFRAPWWKRITLFLSSIPISILMNSLRVGVIGITVEHWGPAMAEGFLHDFEGWVVFMISALLLVLEVILLSRLGGAKAHWRDVFGLNAPASAPAATPHFASGRESDAGPPAHAPWRVSAALVTSVVVSALLAVVATVLPQRAEAIPARAQFAEFPSQFSGWMGRRQPLEQVYLDVLKLDDYVFADYHRVGGATPVNFYTAWYDSQRKGQSVHSPRSCIPGGGWQIKSIEQVTLKGANVGGAPLRANRVLIELGTHRQVVYYWFQQRGRVVTNEYLVKWFIFWDALARNRTDGALVRLSAPVPPGSSDAAADEAIEEFTRALAPVLGSYIPG